MTTKKTAKTTDTPPPAKKAAKHRMVVGHRPIHEGGEFYAPGSEIVLPTGRVKALGDLVKEPAEQEEPKE